MGESPSARTERELKDLRQRIDADVDALIARAKEDVDPRALLRRRPAAVLGTLGSLGTLAAATLLKRARDARSRRPDTEIERVIERLGGRVDRLKGRARKRLRDRMRTEILAVEGDKRNVTDVAWTMGLSALTAGAAALARRFATRVAEDDR